MPQYNSADFLALAPFVILVLGGLLMLMLEVFQDSEKRGYQSWFTVVTAVLAGAAAVPMLSAESPYPILKHAGRAAFAVADRFGGFVTVLVCTGLALSALVAASFLQARRAERGEFYALSMFGAAGMILLAMSTDLLSIFVAIEIMSVATYALAAYLRRGARPAEAAFKYFILGAFSSALYLYGAALVYGATGGKTGLSEIAAFQGGSLLTAGLAFLAAGFFFKVAAAPFHMWTPDVYEGSPTPVTAFMAVGVKAAAFAALVRVFTVAFGGAGAEGTMNASWGNLVAVLAIITMLVGNLLAVPQRSVKRLLAYSSIAHAGYILVGLAAAANPAARASAGAGILYYLAAYTFTGVGAFAVVAALERLEGEGPMSWDLDRFAGIAKSRPGLALAMAIFMLSLAGIPPTAGFAGKLYIFKAAIDAKLYGLAIAGVLTSLIGVYYYLRVVVYMYMREPEASVGALPPAKASMGVALAAAVIGTLVLGLIPSLIGDVVRASAIALGAG